MKKLNSLFRSLLQTPACRKVVRIFANRRFEEPHESEFRDVYLDANLTLLRGALFIGFFFGLATLALDYWLMESGFSSWSVPARAVITQPLVLAAFLASYHPAARKFLAILGIAVGLSVASTVLLLSAFAADQTVGSAFTGYVVVTFYIYFFLGQRFWPAFVAAMALFLSFLAAASLQSQKTDLIIFGTFLLFTNLISAIGLFSHENNHRRMFLERKRLKDLASRDALTGLANRRALDDFLEHIWLHAKRESIPVTLALIDIDHFKAYNDNYGHQAGDRALTAVAQVLSHAMRRPLDFVARMGGEEFVVLLPGATLQNAEQIISDLLLQVRALNICHEASPTETMVTISAGLAYLYPHRTDHSIQGFMQLADQALYQAKHSGRNRVCISGNQDDLNTKTGLFQLKEFKVA